MHCIAISDMQAAKPSNEVASNASERFRKKYTCMLFLKTGIIKLESI